MFLRLQSDPDSKAIMLSKSSHPPNGGRIPSSRLEIYLRYKQDTNAIIAWLMSHGTRKYKNLKTVSIRDLLELAETMRTKTVVMPDTIDFHFREAITARKNLTKFFRETGLPDVEDPETANHEFFTTSLTKIYTDLCDCCARPKGDCKNAQQRRPVHDSQTSSANRFSTLSLGYHDRECIYQDGSSADTPLESQHEGYVEANLIVAPEAKPDPCLVDDYLSDAFEIRQEVQAMSDLLSATGNAWEQAARKATSIVVAAFVTNAAFAMFERVEQRLSIICNGSNPDTLLRKTKQMKELKIADAIAPHDKSWESQQVEALQIPWHLLLQLKHRRPRGSHDNSLPPTSETSQFTISRSPGSEPQDRECFTKMIDNIGQRLGAKDRLSCVVLGGTPVLTNVGSFVSHDENDTNGLRCCFGLQVLLEAYKSYLLVSDRRHAPSRCRLQALRFAQETAASVDLVLADSSMPCRCCQTLALHLESFKSDLKGFLEEKVFDLYFQSPWVSGSHMLEILGVSFYYGVRLFSYRHYVGSILHVYNILRKLTGYREIPLLESLCNAFNDILFPGGRPSRNFKACAMRYMGGRLRFNAQTSNHRTGCHKLEIPVHTAKATAGFGLRKEANDSRFQSCKISLFHHIKEKGYRLDDGLWNRVHHLNNVNGDQKPGTNKRQRSCSYHRHSIDFPSDSPQHRLCQLQKAVIDDFSSHFPVARLNLFKVYTACVQIISLISDKTHGDSDQGSRCLCFLEAMLSAADRHKNNEHKLELFGCKDLVETCKEAMSSVLGETDLHEFLWEGI